MSKASILIVEDEGIVAMGIQNKLEALGYRVVGLASTGEKAIIEAGLRKPDLVLMDVKLIGAMDGIEAADAIRERFEIPVIFLTAFGNEEVLRRAKLTEPYAYILKPFQERELHIAIEMALHQHRMRTALKDSESRYRMLMETSSDAIIVSDEATGEVVDCNPKTEEILGLDRVVMLGARHEDIIPGEKAFSMGAEVETGGDPIDCKVRRADGSEVWVEVGNSRFETGGRNYVQTILRDISARKSSERALYDSEEKYRLMFSRNPMPMWVVDSASMDFMDVNDAALEHYGYGREEFLAMNMRDLRAMPGMPDIFSHDRAADRSGPWRHRKKSGELIDMELTSGDISLERKRARLVLANDITERRRAEEQLSQRQAALQSVYEMATTPGRTLRAVCEGVCLNLSRLLGASGVYVLRLDAGMLRSMAGACGLCIAGDRFGLEPSEKALAALLRDEVFVFDSPRDIGPDAPDALAGAGVCVAVMDTQNRLVGAMCANRAEPSFFKDQEILLIKIFTRYVAFEMEKEHMSERLHAARKMEVFGKLAGGVAHEVRNPLNAIMALSEALGQGVKDDPEFEPFLVHMRAQVERLSILMNDLLDLGKPVEHLRMQPENIKDICETATGLWKHSPRASASGVELRVHEGCEAVDIVADSKRIQQVLINLMDNASEHSQTGSPITLELGPLDDGYIRISVVDRGTGMDEEIIGRVFDPFFSTRRAGTGLGLSIVKHFVESHGGDVAAFNNTPDAGCTLMLRLPVYNENGGGL